MHEKFKQYLNEIGEIPKDINLDTENNKITYRYLEPAYYRKDGCAYGCTGYAELLINGEVKGYFQTKGDDIDFYFEKILHNKNIHRIWGVTNYIWD